MDATKERLMASVEKAADGCWLWTGSVDRYGYGRITVDHKWAIAHRVAYLLLVGPIPEGMTIDHLCRNRKCVNPAHLEPVPMVENTRRGQSFSAVNARKTHCVNGHPFDDSNTYLFRGQRICRSCRQRHDAARRRRRSATAIQKESA